MTKCSGLRFRNKKKKTVEDQSANYRLSAPTVRHGSQSLSMLNKVTCHVKKHTLLETRNYIFRSFYNLCSLIPDALNTDCNPQHDKHHQVGYIHVYELVLFYSR
jgi:hypothetical protein